MKLQKIRERLVPFSRAIDLAEDKTLIDLDSLDKISKRHRDNKDFLKPWQADRTLSLRNRNLRGAMFDRADLRNVDLYTASLQGASLFLASLQGVLLNGARLQGASLNRARLQGASLRGASLQGASLKSASLQGALLSSASFQGASLDYAGLQGAMLDDARLQGASLNMARLEGASLRGASLQGASLSAASLKGASLTDARLQGALLNGASLQGASLHNASLQGALLRNATFQGATLDYAGLQGALLRGASFQGASLNNTYLWRVYGEPDRSQLEAVWVETPQLTPLLQEELAALEEQSLGGVTSEGVKEIIKESLARLFDPENDSKNLPESFWTVLEGKMSEVDYRKNLARRLETQICNDKGSVLYVAQGVIKYRLGRLFSFGSDLLPSVARKLLDDAEGRTIDCPGLKKLDAQSISKLREWAK